MKPLNSKLLKDTILARGWVFVVILSNFAAAAPRFEVSPGINFHSPDVARAMIAPSVQIDVRPNRTFWFGAGGFWGRAIQDRGASAIQDGDRWWSAEACAYWNLSGTLGDDAQSIDLFTNAGPAYVHVSGQGQWAFLLGGGMLVNFERTPWLSLRFDLKNYMYRLENPNGSDFVSDLSLWIGPSFLF